jgi:serine/threonine protein kinase
MKTCHREWPDQFLMGNLSAEDEAAFEAHLEGCGDCRKLLETRAGDEQSWRAAKELLCYVASPTATNDLSGKVDAAERALRVVNAYDSQWESRSPQLVEVDSRALSFLAPSDDPAMMGRIGTYEIIGLLGRGAAGIVLKGFDRSLSRNVAIKVLDPTAANIGAARERFAREARAMAAITHEHVVPVYGVDVHQGLPYFVMEYVAGGSLDRRLLSEGPLETVSVVRIGLQAAQALDAAHQQGLVHRDIKPGNILIDKGTERVRVADFGLARVMNEVSCTRSGFIAGTPQYMAPEQVRAETCDARADLFSLGAVMYAMCTGHPPFRAETVYAVMQRIVHDTPRSIREQNPKIPAWLNQFILRLLSKEKDRRFDSASEVAALLQEELAYLQSPIAVNRPKRDWYETPQSRMKRAWTRKIAIGAAVLLILGFAAFQFLERSVQDDSNVVHSRESREPSTDLSPDVSISTVPLWSADGTQEAQRSAAALEARMLMPPLNDSKKPDPWTEQVEQLHAEIHSYEISDEFAPLQSEE